MCGIAGFWNRYRSFRPGLAMDMVERVRSRGPDGAGLWEDDAVGIALAHRRLAVIDLSSAGAQPMVSPCGRYALVFNGEIYNHLDLRAELERAGHGFAWRGQSDTETLLAALRHWGVAPTLERLNGMFAFGLWDSRERILFLARDRLGVKPIYYGLNGGTFLFGSELKVIAAHPDCRHDVNREALALYLRYGYVPAPWSIFRGVSKLPPGHYVVVRDGGEVIGDPQCYWSLAAVAARGAAEPLTDADVMVDELDRLLRDAVKHRMAADVPLGAFLSGGYDSSTVVAMMQAQSDRPVRTFTIGFHEREFNEARHAKAVAEHLGTEHTELYVTPAEALGVIPELPRIYDEPFGDASQVPTFLVSRLAREQVTVCLSGDGGDELFAGYNRHMLGAAIWRRASRMPRWARGGVAVLLGALARAGTRRLTTLLPDRVRVAELSTRMAKLSSAMGAGSGLEFYRDLASTWKHPTTMLQAGSEPSHLVDCLQDKPGLPGLREQMLYLDMLTYLPDDLLTKIDRASMAVSLEARVPLLDHRVVELAWRVPTEYKVRDGQGKWLLRQVLYRYVPRRLVERPKMGFALPVGPWLRGSLRDWAESLLREDRLRSEGFLDPSLIRRRWREHVAGRGNWQYLLWTVLMFQAWLEEAETWKSNGASEGRTA